MRTFIKYRFDRPTLRLALSYLFIIMLLCISFSVVFYKTSTGGLDFELSSGADTGSAGSGAGVNLRARGTTTNTVSLDTAGTAEIGALNEQLDKQVQAMRMSLLRRLVALNAGVLVTGAFVSYLLARRTMQPIEAAMELQARFSSDASHELRTPLSALRARSEVALRDPKLTLREAKHVIQDGVNQTHRLEQLAEGLLRLSQGDDKVAASKPVSLQEIANEAMNTVLLRAQAKRIRIDEQVLPIMVQANPRSLAQVAVILLDNAIKYSPKGSAVYLTGDTKNGYGLLRIQDKGKGIAARDIEHIFERFYRADTSRSQQGYGLGLSIAQKIVAQQNGRIHVQSTPQKGSAFTVSLPLARL